MTNIINKVETDNHDIKDETGGSCEVTTSLSNTQSRVAKKRVKKKKKDRCNFDKCNSNAVNLVGDCNFCGGHYCSKHRLLESHQCQGLKSCRDQMHQRNTEKLRQEQPVVPKIKI